MSDIVELLESELEEAFEVKDKKSLHRYVVLMVDRFASRSAEEEREARLQKAMNAGFTAVREDVQTIASSMREGFTRMDERLEQMERRFEERFEAVDQRFEDFSKRFDDVNRRFNMLVVLMSVFFTVLGGMMTALRLFG